MQISDEAHFSALMAEIDDSLKRDDVPIQARQIQGWIRVCQRLKLSLPLVGKALPNNYSGDSLSGHIQCWFEARYGDRLKLDFSPGCFPIDIRGDLYLVRLPLIIGRAEFYIERLRAPPKQSHFSTRPAKCNLLDLVLDLTDSARVGLSDLELTEMAQLCFTALEQSSAWQQAGDHFQESIKEDLKLSATLAVDRQHGLSRWHSLQSSEKALKFFIKVNDAHPPHSHNLALLHKQAEQLGLLSVDKFDLACAQCPAQVRYEPATSNSISALSANQAARRICTSVAMQLLALSKRSPQGG